MSMAGHDPLLDWPRPMRVGLQQFLVVVRFDDEGVHLAQALDQHLRWVTEIGDKAEAAAAGVKGVADGLDRIVWHRKSLDGDVADLELGTGPKDAPVTMSA